MAKMPIATLIKPLRPTVAMLLLVSSYVPIFDGARVASYFVAN